MYGMNVDHAFPLVTPPCLPALLPSIYSLARLQSGLFGALTGSGNCKIDIILNANQNDPGIVPIDHHPSWKLHRNPFWRVKHPQAVSGGNKQQDQQPQNNMGGSLNNMMAAGSPGMNPMDPNNNLNGMNNTNMNNMNMNPSMNMNMNPNMNVHMNTPNMSMNPNNIMGNNMQMPNQFPQQQQQQQMQMPGNPMSPQMMMSPPELVHEGFRQAVVAYEASRDVGGVVRLRVPPGKKVEHLGIKVQFIGRIDMVRSRQQQSRQYFLRSFTVKCEVHSSRFKSLRSTWVYGTFLFSCCYSCLLLCRVKASMKANRITILSLYPRSSRPPVRCTIPSLKFLSCSKTWTKNTKVTKDAMWLYAISSRLSSRENSCRP